MSSTVVAPSRRVLLLRILAPASLTLGYLDLVRGGVSVGPVLLVVGYCVLVPALVLKS